MLLKQFVLARINDMRGINLAKFDFDRHNAVYYFIINSSEDIYLRFGGRNTSASDAYLDLKSLELALSLGLNEHQASLSGKRPHDPPVPPVFPRDVPGLRENVVLRNRCVECHHIAHFQTTVAEKLGELVKKRDMFRYPEFERLGIKIDIPRGLLIKETSGPAEQAGLRPGDLIQSLNHHRVLTVADVQYRLNQVDRDSKALPVSVLREDRSTSYLVDLPPDWWFTELLHRNLTINPLVHFEEENLTTAQKQKLNLPVDNFASRITHVPVEALLEEAHTLEEGDIIIAVAGKEKDILGLGAKIHIKLSHKSGSTLELVILRDGRRQTLPLKTSRQVFRRVEDE